jgi:hypothetical protein
MGSQENKNKKDDIPRILQHLQKWKPLYEIATVVSVVVAIIVGGISIRQTQKSLDVAVSSLQMKEKEFLLRNRPLIVISNSHFNGPAGDSKGHKFPRSVQVLLTNISDIPATQIQGTFEIKLNGNILGTSPLSPITLAKGTIRPLALGIPEELYIEAMKPDNHFSATVRLTYSGMLGEKIDQYITQGVFHWASHDKNFVEKDSYFK